MSLSIGRSIVLASATVLAVSACSDHNTSVSPPEFDGAFNPGLQPRVEIHGPYLDEDLVEIDPGVFDLPETVSCTDGKALPAPEQPDAPVLGTGESYATSWKPKKNRADKSFRICVYNYGLGFTEDSVPFIEERLLGYRDVRPSSENEDNRSTDQAPIYRFQSGSNLPIKFRIETGALGCYTREGQIADCTETFIADTGGTAICENSTCSLEVPNGALNTGGFFTIQRIENEFCDATTDSDPKFIDMALPQFPGCVQVTTNATPTSAVDSTNLIIVGACITLTDDNGDLVPALAKLTDEQGLLEEEMLSRLQLHHEYYVGGERRVEALPNNYSAIDNTCHQQLHEYLDNQVPNGPLWPIVAAYNAVRRTVPWLRPTVAHAADRGFGGGFGGAFSPFVWAMPAKMDGLRVDGDNVTPWENPEDGTSGGTITAMAELTNSVSNDCEFLTCPDPSVTLPVRGATVTFSVPADGSQGWVESVGQSSYDGYTDRDGRAAVPWLLPSDPGEYTLNASGFGIGVDGEFAVHYIGGDNNGIVQLGTPTLPFVAATCSDKRWILDNPGVEYDEYLDNGDSVHIPINISGSDGDQAILSWTTDCFNTYFALEIPAAEDLQNSLRIVFAENVPEGAGEFFEAVPVPGADDMWNIFRDKQGAWQIEDWHVSDDCRGSKQSECGAIDTQQDLTSIGDPLKPVGTTSVFEFARSHEADADPLDFPTPGLGPENAVEVGFYLAIQMGKGAQGNTEWPGFRVFKKITIERR